MHQEAPVGSKIDHFSQKICLLSETGRRLSTTLSNTTRQTKKIINITADSISVVVALWVAYTLRLGQPFTEFGSNWYLFLLLPVTTVLFFTRIGAYRWLVRSCNEELSCTIFKGCLYSSLSLLVFVYLVPPAGVTPRSVYIIYGIVLLILTIGSRNVWNIVSAVGSEHTQAIAIYGASAIGQRCAKVINASSQHQVVAFIENQSELVGSTISGAQVINDNNGERLVNNLKRLRVQHVVLENSLLIDGQMSQNVSVLEKNGISCKTIPSEAQILAKIPGNKTVGDINIQDILGRSEIAPDADLLDKCVRNKIVLVTGGGGSIGSELCKQIISLNPKRLVILDSSEFNLYTIIEELNLLAKSFHFSNDNVDSILGSITDKRLLKRLFKQHKIDTVYHAAAYKHVPIVESHPAQGVEVNIYGTLALLDASIENTVKNFLLISSDKAVLPTNCMGATKRIAELILQAKAKHAVATRISMVRFGNVLGSSGSVVPKFMKQIKLGGPVTLTDKDTTRYFMTVQEAVQLVLQASAIAKGGEVFVLDMGEPIRIRDLATKMIKLYGQHCAEGSIDIRIVYQGLRPGEKMHEELFLTGNPQPTRVPKILYANEYNLPWDVLLSQLERIMTIVNQQDDQTLRTVLLALACNPDSYNPDKCHSDNALLSTPAKLI